MNNITIQFNLGRPSIEGIKCNNFVALLSTWQVDFIMGAKLVSGLLFQPPAPTYDENLAGFVWLRTKTEASIAAFYIDNSSKGAQFTLLFSHGNAEDLGLIHSWFTQFADVLNVNLLVYDYEGYGISTGNKTHNEENEPNEQSCYDDIDAAYEYLSVIQNVSTEHLIIYGRSLGSGT